MPDPYDDNAAYREEPTAIDLGDVESWTAPQAYTMLCPRVTPRRFVAQLQGAWAYRLREEFGLRGGTAR